MKHSPGLEEKPKEGVKIENNDHTNLKMAGMDGSLVHFKIKRYTALSKLMKPIVNDRVCQRGRIDSKLLGNQSMKQTHLHSWK